jgi:hypothetical protein
LTAPSAEEKWNPTQKYTLRGVAGRVNQVFLRQREPVLMEFEVAASPEDQWWQITVGQDDDTPVSAEVSKVLRYLLRDAR